MDSDIMDALSQQIPRYNDYLLRGFMAEQIAGAADFVQTMFREAVKLFNGVITYQGYRVFTPERRAEYELERHSGCRVTVSELLLVEYVFVYNGKEYPVPLYIPYLKNNVIVIDDTTYVLQRSIKEQAFSRTTNGITMKVIRQPIPFYNNEAYRLESASDEWSSIEAVPTTSIHRKKCSVNSRARLPEETIIHYLLCKFGFLGTLARFGLTGEDVGFVTQIGHDVETYRYFAAKKAKKKQHVDLFLKARKELLNNPVVSKLVASILYTTTGFIKHHVEDLYEPTGIVFRIMLGKIIYGNSVNEVQGKSKIDVHIASVDTYLDPITRERLHSYGIAVADIYDLLQYVFGEITTIARTLHTDLYVTRIDILEELLVETIVKSVYSRWYKAETDPRKLNEKEVGRILRFQDNLITKLYNSRIVQKNPPAYGDNELVGWLIQKIRQSGLSQSGKIINSPDHRFHPSMLVVESVIAFSKSNPGAAGAINPYLQISQNGSIIKPDYAAEIDELEKYLPY